MVICNSNYANANNNSSINKIYIYQHYRLFLKNLIIMPVFFFNIACFLVGFSLNTFVL